MMPFHAYGDPGGAGKTYSARSPTITLEPNTKLCMNMATEMSVDARRRRRWKARSRSPGGTSHLVVSVATAGGRPVIVRAARRRGTRPSSR